VTRLTSQWKSGKTTLLSILLNVHVAGGELGGLAVKPGRTVILCEESLDLWAPRIDKHRFGDTVCFLSRSFPSIPTEQQWQELINQVLAIRGEHGVDLVVIDPLAPFLRSENHARAMLETLLALRAWQGAGLAVTLLHHPGRGERLPGQAARGSGALLGHVDVSLEMRCGGHGTGRCGSRMAGAGTYLSRLAFPSKGYSFSLARIRVMNCRSWEEMNTPERSMLCSLS
jgi:hypothetical protein